MNNGDLLDNRYLIERKLCEGGMSSLYIAKDVRFDKQVVVKEPIFPSSADEKKDDEKKELETYLENEAKILAKLDHPNIVKVTDFVVARYLVMDFVEGQNLEDRVEKHGQQSQQDVVNWALQIADALCYIHSRNQPVIHRDVKPSNCIITSEGKIKVVDFGIARTFNPNSTKTRIGSQGYIAPEVLDGKTEPKSDVYSLGATMLALLLGKIPIYPEQRLKELRSSRNDISKNLIAIVERAMKYKVNERYSAREMYEGLLNFGRLKNSAGVNSQVAHGEARSHNTDRFLQYIDDLIGELKECYKDNYNFEILRESLLLNIRYDRIYSWDLPFLDLELTKFIILKRNELIGYLDSIKSDYFEKSKVVSHLDKMEKVMKKKFWFVGPHVWDFYILLGLPPLLLNLRANCRDKKESSKASRDYTNAIRVQPNNSFIHDDLVKFFEYTPANGIFKASIRSSISLTIRSLERIEKPGQYTYNIIGRLQGLQQEYRLQESQQAHPQKPIFQKIKEYLTKPIF
ncbi:MAG TPA: serine/threonine-protein kinase [Candidatus Nanoarchaeia archaeon]|nr:serine/threonine-protein kinase [Candidatus Nanoarchaeia archaeon]